MKAVTKKMCIILFFTVPLLFVFCILGGCNDELKEEEEMVADINVFLPGAELIEYIERAAKSEYYEKETEDSVDSADSRDYQNMERVYTFKYKEITFTVREYQYGLGIWRTTELENNYAEQLSEFFNEEKISEISDNVKNANISVAHNNYVLYFTDYVNSFAEIPNGVSAFEEIYAAIYDYLPITDPDDFDVRVTFEVSGPRTKTESCDEVYRYVAKFSAISQKSDIDWGYENERVLMEYKNLADNGYILDPTLTQDAGEDIPVKEINTLYINGEEYVSENYDIRFVYDINTEKYYTEMGGKYNDIADEYLIKEILESYYPDCNYSTENDIMTYRIGTVDYRVERAHKAMPGTLFLYRDGKKKYIKTRSEMYGYTSYIGNRFIDINAFADLLGMSVEKIDTVNKVIYLSVDE